MPRVAGLWTRPGKRPLPGATWTGEQINDFFALCLSFAPGYPGCFTFFALSSRLLQILNPGCQSIESNLFSSATFAQGVITAEANCPGSPPF